MKAYNSKKSLLMEKIRQGLHKKWIHFDIHSTFSRNIPKIILKDTMKKYWWNGKVFVKITDELDQELRFNDQNEAVNSKHNSTQFCKKL